MDSVRWEGKLSEKSSGEIPIMLEGRNVSVNASGSFAKCRTIRHRGNPAELLSLDSRIAHFLSPGKLELAIRRAGAFPWSLEFAFAHRVVTMLPIFRCIPFWPSIPCRRSFRHRPSTSAAIAKIETLEDRMLLTFVMSAQEQLLLELVNRTRQDPQAEAARQGITVEQTGFRAPLAPHQLLINAAGAHSQNMLDLDFFSHVAPDGSGPLDRVLRTGYPATIAGENIAWIGTTGGVDVNQFTVTMHGNLFESPGHRAGMLDTRMREVGIGLRVGEFIDPRTGQRWNALMGTELFAARSSGFFITGVAFTDGIVDDAFYTIGEGLGSITVTARNQTTNATFTTTTGPSGGYSLEVPNGTYTVTFSGGGLPSPSILQNIVIANQNRKLDFDQSNQRASTLPQNFLVVATDAGTGGQVRVLDAQTGFEWLSLTPYGPNFGAGVRVATGDVNGDGVLDIITAPGAGGGPHVMAFDGRNGSVLASFFAYDPRFGGGVFVASADVNGDNRADIITSPGAGGGPHVRVFSGLNQQIITEFMAYAPNYVGGVHVAAGNVDGIGSAEIITATEAGGGPHVRVFSGQTGQQIAGPIGSFFAYSPGFFGGVWVASADVNLDGRSDIITGPGFGGGPHVRVFSGLNGAELNSFFAYSPGFIGGVRVGTSDVDNNGRSDILTSPGPGGGPNIRAFQGHQPVPLTTGAFNFMAFSPGFTGGVHVAGGRNQLSLIQTTSHPRGDFLSADQLSLVIENRDGANDLLGLVSEVGDTMFTIHPIDPSQNADEDDSRNLQLNETTNEEVPVDLEFLSEANFDELFADKLLLAELLSA